MEALAGLTIAVISAGGYVGVAAMMAIESACLPLPSEIIMPFAGYLVSTGRFDLLGVATAGAVGCNIGSAVAYSTGYHGGPPFINRWGRYVLVSAVELAAVERFFARRGSVAVFVGRLMPVVRTFIALPAGVARMNKLQFHIYTFAGSWIWCFVLAWIGARLGEQWNSSVWLRSLFHRMDLAVLALLLAAVGWFVGNRVRASRRI